ncbi:MAG: BON domain-containing protein [Steroidobacteraceae bacterium]
MLFFASKWPAKVVSLMLMTVTLISCSTSPPRSAEQLRADEDTAVRVYAALKADPIYYFPHVEVRVYGGVAHLSGFIWTADALFRAKEITAKVPGVTGVVNEMELEREGELGGGHSGSQ